MGLGGRQEIVFLILAGRVEALAGLLGVVDGRFRVVVHFDAKLASVDCGLPSHASATERRYDVFWGGFNMMLAITELIDTAYRVAPDFRRAVLITGDTLPVVSCDRLEAALLDERKEFILLHEIADDASLRGLTQEEGRARHGGSVQPWRFQNFTCYDNVLLSPKSAADVTARYGLSQGASDELRGGVRGLVQDLLRRLPPRPDLFERLFYGESWWGLTREAVDLIVDELHAEAFVEFFRFLEVPDEHFIQTLLGNKRRALASLGREVVGTPVYVNHADPVRARFGRDALQGREFRDAGRTGRYLFARKYDPELSPEIADAIGRGRYERDILGMSF